MAKLKEIKAAVDLIDPKDDAQWEADGTPKADVVANLLGDPVTVEQLAAFRRPGWEPKTPEVAEAEEQPYIDYTKVNLNTLDSQTARTILVQQRKRLAEVDVELQAMQDDRSRLTASIDETVQIRDRILKAIEVFSPRVSHADAVKAVQAQTQARLKQTKEASILAAQALAASGTKLFPSRLDESLAHRMRTPEQKKNYAAYVHQNSAAISAARG